MTPRYRFPSPPSLAPLRACVVALALALSGLAGCMIGGATR